MTRWGDCLKVLVTNFLLKFSDGFLGYNGKHHILVKTTLATIWASFGENWATFMSTSGHTDCDAEYEI